MSDKKNDPDKADEKNKKNDKENKSGKEKKKRSIPKLLLKIFAWIFGSIFALLLLLLIFLDPILKFSISEIGSWALGVDVSIEHLDTSFSKCSLSIKGLKVANPDDFNTPNLLKLDDFYVEVDRSTIFSDQIVINQIRLEGLAAEAGFNGSRKFNVTEITDFLKNKFAPPEESPAQTAESTPAPQTAEPAPPDPAPQPEAKDDSAEETSTASDAAPAESKSILIKDLDISLSLSVFLEGDKGKPDVIDLSLPLSYSKDNIVIGGKDENIDYIDMLCQQAEFLEQLCRQSVETGQLLFSSMDDLFRLSGDFMNNGIDTFKNLGKNVQKGVSDFGKNVKDGVSNIGKDVEDIGNSFKNIFKRDKK